MLITNTVKCSNCGHVYIELRGGINPFVHTPDRCPKCGNSSQSLLGKILGLFR